MKSSDYIGFYLLLVLLILCAIPTATYWYSDQIHSERIRFLLYLGSSGGIGGTLYAIRALYTHLGNGDYITSYEWWYILRPVISILIGVFAYFILAGGLMAVSQNPDFGKGLIFYCGLSFLAGYSLNQFLDKLKDLSKTIFANSISNVSDEIQKLLDLKEKGAITDKEFQSRKRKLLDS